MLSRKRPPELVSSGNSIILLDRRYSDHEGLKFAIIPFKVANHGIDT